MFFEGPEKKVEIGLVSGARDLLALPDTYWAARVEEAGAVILSTISTPAVRAYLLSESSLFVYARRVVMITCGRTDLAAAAETMLHEWAGEVEFLIYERKNEHFPEYQPTNFLSDAKRLAQHIPATGWRYGSADGHRIQILSSQAPMPLDPNERTLEILMHGIHPEAAAMFGPERHRDGPRYAQFRKLFDGFEVDEHWFNPAGYSVNALRGPEYLTIHATPEQIASYVSFETNVPFGDSPYAWVKQVQAVFEPQALDVMTFSYHPISAFNLDQYHTVNWVRDPLPCGFHVGFQHFEFKLNAAGSAFHLPLQD